MADNHTTRPVCSKRQQIIQDSARYLFATIAGQGIGLARAGMMPVPLSSAQLGVWNLKK